MKINDIIGVIEDFAPLDLQEEYDNSGLVIGDREKEVVKVLIAVDVTEDVVDEAIREGAGLIISHHPIIFNPIRYITTDDLRGELLLKIIRNDIAVYAAHTNVDNADESIAREFLEGLDAENICPMVDCSGIYGSLSKPLTFGQLIEKIRAYTGDSNIKTIGNFEDIVEEISFLNGANGNSEDLLVQAGSLSDVMITSEVRYHIASMAKQLDINIIELGHFESEKCFMELICRKLKEKIKAAEILISKESKSPYNN